MAYKSTGNHFKKTVASTFGKTKQPVTGTDGVSEPTINVEYKWSDSAAGNFSVLAVKYEGKEMLRLEAIGTLTIRKFEQKHATFSILRKILACVRLTAHKGRSDDESWTIIKTSHSVAGEVAGVFDKELVLTAYEERHWAKIRGFLDLLPIDIPLDPSYLEPYTDYVPPSRAPVRKSLVPRGPAAVPPEPNPMNMMMGPMMMMQYLMAKQQAELEEQQQLQLQQQQFMGRGVMPYGAPQPMMHQQQQFRGGFQQSSSIMNRLGGPTESQVFTQGVCFEFQKGRCSRGDGCRFSHATNSSSSSHSNSHGTQGVCYEFQKGNCLRGDNCRYLHVGGFKDRGPSVCFSFRDTGYCDRGDTCRFASSHVKAPDGAPNVDNGLKSRR